jgi:DIM1 family U5 snRNP protein
MYELYDPCTVMFFYRNKHIMIDLGTGNNNKINWAMDDKQEMIDVIEVCIVQLISCQVSLHFD